MKYAANTQDFVGRLQIGAGCILPNTCFFSSGVELHAKHLLVLLREINPIANFNTGQKVKRWGKVFYVWPPSGWMISW